MVIPEERDGRLEEHPDLCRDTTPANATVNTRKGGMQEAPAQRKVWLFEICRDKYNIAYNIAYTYFNYSECSLCRSTYVIL